MADRNHTPWEHDSNAVLFVDLVERCGSRDFDIRVFGDGEALRIAVALALMCADGEPARKVRAEGLDGPLGGAALCVAINGGQMNISGFNELRIRGDDNDLRVEVGESNAAQRLCEAVFHSFTNYYRERVIEKN